MYVQWTSGWRIIIQNSELEKWDLLISHLYHQIWHHSINFYRVICNLLNSTDSIENLQQRYTILPETFQKSLEQFDYYMCLENNGQYSKQFIKQLGKDLKIKNDAGVCRDINGLMKSFDTSYIPKESRLLI